MALKNPDAKAFAAEFVATTLFVWVACGSAVTSQAMEVLNPDSKNSNGFLVAVSLAFGFAIVALVYAIAPFSGGHINPAVSLAFLILGQMPIWKFLYYAIAQCLGAVLGTFILFISTNSEKLKTASGEADQFLLGANSVENDIPLFAAFVGEAMGTFLLVWTVLMTAVSKKSIAGNIAPLAIGISVFLANVMLIPLTGCGINPARTFGPHIFVYLTTGATVTFRGWWVYYTAPFVGAAAAAVTCKVFFDVTDEEEAESSGLPTESTPLVK